MRCGTPGYVDPEVLKGKPFSMKSDIFSAGSIFYNLVTLQFLFPGHTPQEVLLQNTTQNPKLVVRLFVKQVSQECRSLLTLMLDPQG